MKPVIFTSFNNDIDPRFHEYQAKIMKKFGLEKIYHPLKYEFHYSIMTHGDVLNKFVNSLFYEHGFDCILIMDIDCIPLSREGIEKVFEYAEDGCLVGNIQRSNHIQNNKHLYAASSFICFTKDLYRQIGRPSFLPSDEVRGIPTGFPAIDNKLAGFQKSDLIILAARPSMGKTSLALDFARLAAIKHNIPVGIFSLEMSSQQLVDRMLSAESQVDSWKIRTGQNLNVEHDFKAIRDAMDRLSTAPIYIDDQPANNILKMRAVARRLKSEKGLGLIIVDYLQLMVPTQSRNSDNVVQQVTEISRSLKQLARELEVPVIALSQLSRAVEQRGGEPRLSDLRDSGSIEQDADVVMFIHREDKHNKDASQARPNVAKIMIEKHRNGPTGYAELYFDDKKTSFMSIEKNDFGDFDNNSQQGNGSDF
jgi:replicative DNA helicase